MAGGAGDERRRAAQLAALEARVAALEGAAGRLGEAERGHLAAALAQALEQMPPGMEAALRRGSEGQALHTRRRSSVTVNQQVGQ